MSNFQTRFDSATPEARRLVAANAAAIRQLVPNFYTRDFDRLMKSISALLEKVDKGKIDHPEYLAHSSGSYAEYAVQLVIGVPSSISSGAPHFVQTTLPPLAMCEERLALGVGNHFFKVRSVKDAQVRELQKLAEDGLLFRNQALKAKQDVDEIIKSLRGNDEEIKAISQYAGEARDKIEQTREAVTKLASGDGRGKSLESLKRTAEEKVAAIQQVLTQAETASATVSEVEEQITRWKIKFSDADLELTEIQRKAAETMNLSSQAGLASSYLKESRNLQYKSIAFSTILYATSIVAALIAAFYVLPSLQSTIEHSKGGSSTTAVTMALLRATVLAPLVYMIYFTSKQISMIEMVRLDYAEKAAASLAYSGYKDEMAEDRGLLERLRGSLLLKFAEHPERLLRKLPVVDKIEVETPGFKASSSSAESPVTDEAS